MDLVLLHLMLDICLSFHKILPQPHWVNLKSRSLILDFIIKLLFIPLLFIPFLFIIMFTIHETCLYEVLQHEAITGSAEKICKRQF